MLYNWLFPLIVFSGSILGYIFNILIGPVRIGIFSIGILHIAYIIVLFPGLDLFLGRGGDKRLYIFGILNGIFIYSFIKTAGWGYVSISFIIIVIIELALLSFFKVYTKKLIWEKAADLWKLIGSGIFLISFSFFRILNQILLKKGIPNEERSFMIQGVEIHHLTTGALLLVIFIPLCYWIKCKGKISIILRIILLIALSCIADQFSYMALSDISDTAYFSKVSFIGGGLVTLFCVFYLWKNRLRSLLKKI